MVRYRNVWADTDMDNYEYCGDYHDTLEKATKVAHKDLSISPTLTLVRQEKVTMPLFGPIKVEVV